MIDRMNMFYLISKSFSITIRFLLFNFICLELFIQIKLICPFAYSVLITSEPECCSMPDMQSDRQYVGRLEQYISEKNSHSSTYIASTYIAMYT